MKALLIGKEPAAALGYEYGEQGYEAVVIGSLTLSQALSLREEWQCRPAPGRFAFPL